MKLRFTTRDLLWLTIIVALLASNVERRLAIMEAEISKDLKWQQLARDAGVYRQIEREYIRQLFSN